MSLQTILEQLSHVATIGATGLALLGFLWGILNRLINQHHASVEKLEKQKVELQKELEETRQRHVSKLIETIRSDLSKLAHKLDEMRQAYFILDKKIASNEGRSETVLTSLQDFSREAKKRFIAVEKQIQIDEAKISEVETKIESQMEQIGKDLYIIREAARKVKKNE